MEPILATYCVCGQTYEKDQFMLQCDYCKDWYHGNCVDIKEYNAIELDKYHCPRCLPIVGPPILKGYLNFHRHDFWDPDARDKPVQTGTAVFIRELCTRHFSNEDVVVQMRGQQLTETFLQQNGFNLPILIDGKDGLDMTIPPDNFSLYDVESYIGGDKEIDVIDVTRQCDFKMWLRDFVEYFNSVNRSRVFNCVSLEFSTTSLATMVEAPLVARRLDWVNIVWPRDQEDGRVKPLVQKYCLMSVKDSFTDFHIDFGGTSVWYHILRGEKVFYFIRPTPANLLLYQQWMNSTNQSETFFGDQVDQCHKCILRQGQTMLIPTGWIHAVLTTQDSLVFGGNFLHSYNIPMQLQIYDIEKKIKTAERFKFPSFETINWYAAKRIMNQLKEINSEDRACPDFLLTGAKGLLAALKQWNTDKDYNLSNRGQIPDVINSHKLLKDLGKEIRHSERFIHALNPPKPERESKRKRKKPVNKDFVDFYTPIKSFEQVQPVKPKPVDVPQMTKKYEAIPSEFILHSALTAPISPSKASMSNYPNFFVSEESLMIQSPGTSSSQTIGGDSSTDDRNWADYPVDPNERWIVTNVPANDANRPGAILKFKLGSKDSIASTANGSAQTHSNLPEYEYSKNPSASSSVFDFNEEAENRDDEFTLSIDESPKKRRYTQSRLKTIAPQRVENSEYAFPESGIEDIQTDSPKNGIDSLLKASALTNKLIDSGRASPSTREAIAGMLSIGQPSNMLSSCSTPSKNSRRRKAVAVSSAKDHYEENIRNVHQDEDYIYPSLDNSDEEDFQIFKPRGRSKVDEAWNPKARVGPLLPKMNRPAREGTKKQAVEKVLEAAAAKRALEPTVQELTQKRTYKKKKIKVAKTPPPPKETPNPPSSSAKPSINHKPKKGMKTAKQRLGKILKIHKMMH